jgi:hypothetical protein
MRCLRSAAGRSRPQSEHRRLQRVLWQSSVSSVAARADWYGRAADHRRARSGRSWIALKGRGRPTTSLPLITTLRRALPIAGPGTSSRSRAGRKARSRPAHPGLYLCQVTASNFAGSTVQTSDASTISPPGAGGGPSPSGPPPPPVAPPPPIPGKGPLASKLRVSPTAFTAAESGPSTITPSRNPRHHHHATPGARVSYTLNVAATGRFTVQQRLPGREQRHGKTAHCVAVTHRNRRAHRCTRTKTFRGSFTHTGPSGANRLRFSGRLDRHKLNRGSYTLVATPRASGKTGCAIKGAFRIIH